MNKRVDEIIDYMSFLREQLCLNISVHFTDEELMKLPDSVFSKLLPYNCHSNPYCEFVKKSSWKGCVANQERIFAEAGQEESRTVCCHAGVREEIYYFRRGTAVLGYVAVSGFRDEYRQNLCRDRSLWENCLSSDTAPECCSAVISPLCRMFELLFLNPIEAEDSGDLRLILKYINERHGIVTLDELCEQFGRSPSYISHLFHEKCGKTIPEYCMDLKLIHASEMLLNENVSVTDVSMNSGFGSTSYFIMCFKNKYGVTPLQLKKGR